MGTDERVGTRVPGSQAYDEGYAACDCFWGRDPGSLVRQLLQRVESIQGWHVLDVGCGEGKNAVHLKTLGASRVVAIDSSTIALSNAKRAFPQCEIEWRLGDARSMEFERDAYDLVIAYGLLHCLSDEVEIRDLVRSLRGATRVGGRSIVCAFSNRRQDLTAHPGFHPCLLSHSTYAALYQDWVIEDLSDSDLSESHPHNGIEHIHSMTRMIARRI
jgi:ubiquinone/menaquinone biosynthesis C-methylase UbiE